MGKRSILLTIEDAKWNAFKSKVALSGASMAEVFKEFIRDYVAGARKPSATVRDIVVRKDIVEDMPALDATVEEPEISERERSKPEDVEPAAEREAPTRKTDRYRGDAKSKKETVSRTQPLKYARTFSISTEGKEEEKLLDEVLDAIEKDFKQHKKLGEKEFHEYLDGNRPMLEWFNANRGE